MAITYDPIATISTSTATLTFSSIPQTYTDLYIVYSGFPSANFVYYNLRFNGDTTSNYTFHGMGTYYSGGNANASENNNNTSSIQMFETISNGSGTAYPVSYHINIFNYTTTTRYKHANGYSTATRSITAAAVGNWGGAWKTGNAVTSVSLSTPSGSMSGTATLFGILKA